MYGKCAGAHTREGAYPREAHEDLAGRAAVMDDGGRLIRETKVVAVAHCAAQSGDGSSARCIPRSIHALDMHK